MRADELIKRYSMSDHVENGLFVERHYIDDSGERPASGSIFYYVAPGERTAFHKIDCDEYWCYNAGCTLELWVIGLDGKLRVLSCGTGEGAEPFVRFAKGEIFASRLPEDAHDGAFITCITVPRFSYDGFEMFTKDQIIALCPQTEKFWD